MGVGRRSLKPEPPDHPPRVLHRAAANIDQPQLPHPRHRGHQEMRRLPRAQCYRQVIIGQTIIQCRARVGGDPAGQINRDPLAMARRQTVQQRQISLAQPARQPGAEQTIDQHIAIHWAINHCAGIERTRHPCRIGARLCGRNHHNMAAPPPDCLGNHPAVAAIIARPGQHRDPAQRPGDAPDIIRRPVPRALHQFIHADPARDQRAFGGAHLLGGQDLRQGDHFSCERSRTAPLAALVVIAA